MSTFLKKNRELLLIIFIIIFWRFFLIFTINTSSNFFPLQNDYLGGSKKEYLRSPTTWSFANFDGERYIHLARNGYTNSEYYYFPLYSLVLSKISFLWGAGIYSYLYSGMFVSFFCFLFLIFGFWKLLRIDFSKKITLMSIVMLILFPTSFYLVSVYTESFFLVLCIWSFYFARKGKWFPAALLAMFASATRVVGIAMFISILIEYFSQNNWKLRISNYTILNFFKITFSTFGLIVYLAFLKLKTGNFFAFYNNLEQTFGSQRSSHFVLLPQVLYRYIFKILPNLNYHFFPNLYSGYLEFILSILFLFIILISFRKVRFSYFMFSLFIYLIPTLSGSFSSMPRYLLPCFVVYIMFAKYLSLGYKRFLFFCVILLFMVVLNYISFGLFSNGYWLS